MKRKTMLIAALIGTLTAGYALGQQNTADSSAKELLDNYTAADNGDTSAYGPMIDSFARMPGNADTTKQAARLAFTNGQRGKEGPGFAALIAQNQKIIEQNDHITALLEKIAAKK